MVHHHPPTKVEPLVMRPWQRISHIFSHYQLWGQANQRSQTLVMGLLRNYPPPLVELAVVEVLAKQWLTPNFPRGIPFIRQVDQWLVDSSTVGFELTILPPQFQHITGLDAEGVYPLLPHFLVWTGERLLYDPVRGAALNRWQPYVEKTLP